MRTKLLFAGLSLLSVQAFAQSNNCEDLLQENASLRNALDLRKPEKTITASGVDFNLIKCIGNKKEQTVAVHLTLVNKEANRNFQFRSAKAIDIEGNDYNSSGITIGADGVRSQIFTDTPVKAKVILTKVLTSSKIFKLVNIEYYDAKYPGRTHDFQFQDLDIKWE